MDDGYRPPVFTELPPQGVSPDDGRASVGVTVSPGWYPDPAGEKAYRYWDGAAWTARTAHAHQVVKRRRRRRWPRRLLWSLYAIPLTLATVTSIVPEASAIGWLPATVDVVVSIPSLLGLYFHIWDRRTLSGRFWKPYAFFIVAWDVVGNLIVAPLLSGRPAGAGDVAGALFFVPLYVALFLYAYRDWSRAAEAAASSAGWYPDPARVQAYRYWDGTGWTTRTAQPDDRAFRYAFERPRPLPAAATAPPPPLTAPGAAPPVAMPYSPQAALPGYAVPPPPPRSDQGPPPPWSGYAPLSPGPDYAPPPWTGFAPPAPPLAYAPSSADAVAQWLRSLPAPAAKTMVRGPHHGRGRRVIIALPGLIAPAMIALASLRTLLDALSSPHGGGYAAHTAHLQALSAGLGLALAAGLLLALGAVTLPARVTWRLGMLVVALTLVPLGVTLDLCVHDMAVPANAVRAVSLLVIAGMALIRLRGPGGSWPALGVESPAERRHDRLWSWLALPALAGPAMVAGGGLLSVTTWWSNWATLPSGPDGDAYAGGLLTLSGAPRWLSLGVMALGFIACFALVVAVAPGFSRRRRRGAAVLAVGMAVVFLATAGGGEALGTDWAGYAATGASFGRVTATWTQPAVPAARRDQVSSSFWVGLDGFDDRTVEQIGTTLGGDTWYEMYPLPVERLHMVARPGDVMTATVTRSAPHEFVLSLVDHTSRASATTTQRNADADATSAEVVAEAQWWDKTPFGGFSRVQFTRCAVDGLPLSSFDLHVCDVRSGRLTRATRSSALQADGTAFTIARVSPPLSFGGQLRGTVAHALPHDDDPLFALSLIWLIGLALAVALTARRTSPGTPDGRAPGTPPETAPGPYVTGA